MKPVVELIDYCCGDCGGNVWSLQICHTPDGRTILNIICSNEDCWEKKREELDANEEDLIVWAEFDITGQGFDEMDCHEPGILN